ncbi:MAG: hypothetical protein M1834_000120 [Cirrosporium novae-zelandiae]|nr:MAG: hypothetical protein M1834_000120 [Cirrosporium novae-zelandiae]
MVHPNAGEQPVLPTTSVSINGTDDVALDRFKIREMCEGWPSHRDACEWEKYRALFGEDGYVFTTWSSGRHIDDFIRVSVEGFKNGDWIMHRACGVTCDVATSGPAAGKRGLGKMKAVITQRFMLPAQDGNGEVAVDIECDSQFWFFTYKDPKFNNDWKTNYVKLIYAKDKMIPVDPLRLPKIDRAELEKYPEGYQYLSYGQAYLGHPILMGLPERNGTAHDELYEAGAAWLKGESVKDLLHAPK